jgi:N-acyl-L-homoserine lactone synthetase
MPLRLLRCVVVKAGCQVQVLGPSRLIGRFPTVAAYLTVSPDVLAELRHRAALGGPVLHNDVSIAA